jgi:hypothetical protein
VSPQKLEEEEEEEGFFFFTRARQLMSRKHRSL